MSDTIDIDYWTEEYRKCMESAEYFQAKYMRVKERNGEPCVVIDMPDELKIGGINYNASYPAPQYPEWMHPQRIINRLLNQIASQADSRSVDDSITKLTKD